MIQSRMHSIQDAVYVGGEYFPCCGVQVSRGPARNTGVGDNQIQGVQAVTVVNPYSHRSLVDNVNSLGVNLRLTSPAFIRNHLKSFGISTGEEQGYAFICIVVGQGFADAG